MPVGRSQDIYITLPAGHEWTDLRLWYQDRKNTIGARRRVEHRTALGLLESVIRVANLANPSVDPGIDDEVNSASASRRSHSFNALGLYFCVNKASTMTVVAVLQVATDRTSIKESVDDFRRREPIAVFEVRRDRHRHRFGNSGDRGEHVTHRCIPAIVMANRLEHCGAGGSHDGKAGLLDQ